MKRGKKPGIYALYRGDEFLMLGTVREIAEARNTTPHNVTYLLSALYKKRLKAAKNYSNKLILIAID